MWPVVALLVAVFSACESGQVQGSEPVRVAVASNFASVFQQVADAHGRDTGVVVEISSGSSGKLAAQIGNGAPFDLFLSADGARPTELEQGGHAVRGSRFVYAIGRLVVCGRALPHAGDGLAALKAGQYDKLAIANPETAPYGIAAKQVLERLGLWEKVEGRVVRGENIAQSYQFVDSGAADLGIVARSLTVGREPSCFLVPSDLHDPIVQEAVVLKRAASDERIDGLVKRLRSAETRALLERSGYDAPR